MLKNLLKINIFSKNVPIPMFSLSKKFLCQTGCTQYIFVTFDSVHKLSAQKNRKIKLKNINKKNTVSKGYRLKPATHKLIKKVQRLLNTSQDTVISTAVKNLANKFRSNNKESNLLNNSIIKINKGNTTK